MVDAVVKMEGLDELTKKLDALKYDMQKKGGRFALRKAADVVLKAARANALRVDDTATPTNIARNLTLRWNGKLNRMTGDLGFRVGVLGGARAPAFNAKAAASKARARRRAGIPSLAQLGEITGNQPGGQTYYWRFLEFGTEKMAAKPFMRPALEANIQRATDEFIRQYQKRLPK